MASATQAEVGALGELCDEIHVERQVARITPIRGSYAALSAQRAVIDGALAVRLVGSLYPLYREPGTFLAQRERLRRQGLPVPR